MDRNQSRSIATPLGDMEIIATANGCVKIECGELPKVLDGGDFEVCRAVAILVTVEPIVGLVEIRMTARLSNKHIIGGPATGQGLDCIEWESDGWHVTVGTYDLECLQEQYPEIQLNDGQYPIEYGDHEISFYLEALKRSTTMTFHFILSYQKLTHKDDLSAWLSSDRSHDVVKAAIHR